EVGGEDAGMIGGGIAVLGVDNGAGDALAPESLVQRSLIDRRPASDVQYDRRRAHRRIGLSVHHPNRIGVRRYRDHTRSPPSSRIRRACSRQKSDLPEKMSAPAA